MKKIFSLLLVVTMILSLCACGNDEKNDNAKATILTNENESVIISVEELMEIYDSNQAKFDKLYYGAKIEFEGTIKSIETNTSVIVKKGSVTANQNKVVFEEGWCLVVGVNNTDIDLADFNVGEVVNITTSIVGAPFDTDFIKEVCDNNRVVWLVGNDTIHGQQYSDIKTIIEKTE